ncbi:MAG: metallophosphoesterase [Planctomycetota bacterium]|nr:metallophosphoesterase [Planctomycetota bacterium]
MTGRRCGQWLLLATWVLVGPPSGGRLAAVEGDGCDERDRSPYLQMLTTTGVLVVSRSAEPRAARLRLGLDPSLSLRLLESQVARRHVFRLEGLQPASDYFYEVEHVGLPPFPAARFRTLPEPGGEVRLAVIGDSGTLSDEQFAVARLLETLSPDLLLHTGDAAYPFGTPQNYSEKFFDVYEGLLSRTCVYPALGNHDCFITADFWLDAFYLPANNPDDDESYYSFDAGDAHFAALNTCTWDLPPEQVEWLDEDLLRSRATWNIVYFHHSIYSNAFHGGNLRVRDAVLWVLEKHGVDLVICGHDHAYERSYPLRRGIPRGAFREPDYVDSGGTVYLVTGGGGAGLYPHIPSPDIHLSAVFHSVHHAVSLVIRPGEIVGEAIDIEGEVIDRFSIRKGGEAAQPLYFVRGDADGDGDALLTDAVVILSFLFTGGVPPCLAASDVNASGDIVITDAIYLLNHLFTGGPPPPAPFPECGAVDGADDGGCLASCAEEEVEV